MQKATITRLVSELTEQKVRQLLVELLTETGSKTVAAQPTRRRPQARPDRSATLRGQTQRPARRSSGCEGGRQDHHAASTSTRARQSAVMLETHNAARPQ
jgi:hypothetical protein